MNTPNTCDVVSEHYFQRKEPGIAGEMCHPRLGATILQDKSENPILPKWRELSALRSFWKALEADFKREHFDHQKSKDWNEFRHIKYIKIPELIMILKEKK